MQTEKVQERIDSLHPPEAWQKQELHSHWAPPEGTGPCARIWRAGGGVGIFVLLWKGERTGVSWPVVRRVPHPVSLGNQN